MRWTMLGVPVDTLTHAAVKEKILTILEGNRSHVVTTPNPEMIVDAQKHPRFRAALAAADLAVPDGFGLKLFAPIAGGKIPERVTGVDVMQDICTIAASRGLRVFLLGGAEGVAASAASALTRLHPNLRIVGAESGGAVRRLDDGRISMSLATGRVREAAPEVLFVAFGHGKQEEWIVSHLPELPSVKLAVGIGGAFDFLAGRVRRAPRFFRRLGLEWLWRLALEPRRLPRIWNALVVFPMLIIREKLRTIRR